MKKVLIVTYSFPPLNNIASRRFGEMIGYLKNLGWDPYVLTTSSEGVLEIPISEEKIFRVGRHPSTYNKTIKTVEMKKTYLRADLIKYKRNLGLNSRIIDRTYNNWYRKVKKMNIKLLEEIKFDIIVASFGPGAALLIGKYLSKKLNVPWIADFRDLGALYRDKYYKKNRIFHRIDLFLEKKILKSAVAITTVSNGLKQELEKQYEQKIYVVYNGWNEKVKIENNNIKFIKPYIYYAGRFYTHQMASLFMLMKVLQKKEINFVIRSLGPEDLTEKLIREAENLGIQDKVKVLPQTDPITVEKEANEAAFNLVIEDLEKDYDWKKGTLTGKFLRMLVMKPPILAIARDDSEIGEILKVTNKGRLCSEVKEIESLLEFNWSYQEDKNIIRNYSKENQANILSEIMIKYI